MSKHADALRRICAFSPEDFSHLEGLLKERDELYKALIWLVNVIDGPTNKRNVLVNMPAALANARKVISGDALGDINAEGFD